MCMDNIVYSTPKLCLDYVIDFVNPFFFLRKNLLARQYFIKVRTDH